MAKPKGLNVAQVQAALLQSGGNVTLAAYRLGVCEQTVRYYRHEYPQCRMARPTPHPIQQIILNLLAGRSAPIFSYQIQFLTPIPIPESTARYHLRKLEAAGKVRRDSQRGGFRIAPS